MKLKTTGKSAIKWAPQALRPLVSCFLSPVSYKKYAGDDWLDITVRGTSLMPDRDWL